MYDVLKGVRVVEIGSFVFVPLATAVLADWGAEVIKIEHPRTGDPYRGLVTAGMTSQVDDINISFQYANRGKRSIGLDLGKPEGRAMLDMLLAQADVFVTNLRPAVRSRLRLGVEDIRKANPNIVYVRGAGYAQKGAQADTAALDGTAYWARAGVSAALTPPGSEWPLNQRPAFGDVMCAMTLAGGIAAALYRRAAEGKPSIVDVALMNVGMWQIQRDILSAPFERADLTQRAVGRTERNPLTNAYRTQDGRFITLAIVNPDSYWAELCRVIGRPELVDDARFVNAKARRANVEACVAILDAVFGAQNFDYWRKALAGFSGAWAPVQRPAELHADPEARDNGFFTELAFDDGRKLDVVSSPVTFDEFSGPRQMPAAPEVGQHTEEILLELGCSWEEIETLKDKGAIT
ncbi:Crotonobetainyl-CoA:carnitine CoA-transferase CaiB [Sphingomonas sp. YR710]|uniref:CaiB/BaiF CoA transferase family protein n=1 Tax=Sphingomonas sp. YR710 TaxID=1882773 RepID=UPI00088C1667|nr:CoA transferase [Sphingomonas sp. YR710]SDD50226.1 Crotonobetainyl-CoA:carnitine CoA-transferase CaiB [Sphingomonas sp. YR710]